MPLSEVLNPARYDDPEWMAFHAELAEYPVRRHMFQTENGEINRKGWEWTHAIYGLSKLGMVHSRAHGLGIGTGRDAPTFWFADRCARIVATDLYGNDTWGDLEASADIVANPQSYCRKKIDAARLEFQCADGTDLPFAAESFDFCWSLSSIEHFGSHDMAAKAVREMARILKPGGCAAIATEYLLRDECSHPEYFNRADIGRYVVGADARLTLADGISWSLPPVEYLIDSVVLWHGVHRRRRHVVLNDGTNQWTSIMIFLRKERV